MPALHSKPGVQYACFAPGGLRILAALSEVGAALGIDLVITCGTDSHPPTDPHSLGEAYDVRVSDFTADQILALVKALWKILGSDSFYLQYECAVPPDDVGLRTIAVVNPTASGGHIHVQVRKGRTYPPVVAT